MSISKKSEKYIITDSCIRCKVCYPVCSQKAIKIAHRSVVIDQNLCVQCGQCEIVCPMNAIEKY